MHFILSQKLKRLAPLFLILIFLIPMLFYLKPLGCDIISISDEYFVLITFPLTVFSSFGLAKLAVESFDDTFLWILSFTLIGLNFFLSGIGYLDIKLGVNIGRTYFHLGLFIMLFFMRLMFKTSK